MELGELNQGPFGAISDPFDSKEWNMKTSKRWNRPGLDGAAHSSLELKVEEEAGEFSIPVKSWTILQYRNLKI